MGMPVFPPVWLERSADLPPPPQPAANISAAIVSVAAIHFLWQFIFRVKILSIHKQ
jgi:hypothetical protein